MNMAERRPPGSFEQALGDFADDARRTEAQRGRQQLHDNAVVAGLSGSFHGSLVELAEIGTPIVLITRGGLHHRGAIVAVGSDVVALAPDAGGKRILISIRAIEAVRGRAAPKNRTADDSATGPSLAILLDEFAQDRARVALTTAGGHQLMGTLVAVGIDQVTLRLDGNIDLTNADQVTVALGSVDEAVIEP